MLKVPINAATLAAWMDDASASWEDHGSPSEGHVYNILGRMKTRLVICDADELRLLIDDAEYRRPHHWDDRIAYRSAMGRIWEKLLEAEV